jgi:replicative DNA helicase
MEIRAKARRLVAEKNVGLFMVDYLQLVRGPRTVESRQIEISFISQSLKRSQRTGRAGNRAVLSRAVEQRGGDRQPILSDLRESSAIEQDTDVMLFIYRSEVYDRVEFEGISEIIIGKQRNGPTGTVKAMFLKDYVLFTNLEKNRPDFPPMESPF